MVGRGVAGHLSRGSGMKREGQEACTRARCHGLCMRARVRAKNVNAIRC